MKQDKITKIVPYIGTLAAILIVGGLVSAQTYGGWTDAPANPPSGNVAAPINAGPVYQTKEGHLQLNSSFGVSGTSIFADTINSNKSNGGYNLIVNQDGKGAYGLAVNANNGGFSIDDVGSGAGQTLLHITNSILGGNVAVGTVSPSAGLKLDVEGKVGATAYCDEKGENCYTTAQMAATGGTGGGTGVGDNLGNHTATQNLNMSGFNVVGAGWLNSTGNIDATGKIQGGSIKLGNVERTTWPTISLVNQSSGGTGPNAAQSEAVDTCSSGFVVGGNSACSNDGSIVFSRIKNNGWEVRCQGRLTPGGSYGNTVAQSIAICLKYPN